MLSQVDQSYYWIRASEELERGDQAANADIAAIHYELSYRYGRRAAQTGSGKPRLTLIDGGAIHWLSTNDSDLVGDRLEAVSS